MPIVFGIWHFLFPAKPLVHLLGAQGIVELDDRYALDLNPCVTRQPGRLNRRPRRFIVEKIAGVNIVHCGKFTHIRQENCRLYYVVQTSPGRLKHS